MATKLKSSNQDYLKSLSPIKTCVHNYLWHHFQVSKCSETTVAESKLKQNYLSYTSILSSDHLRGPWHYTAPPQIKKSQSFDWKKETKTFGKKLLKRPSYWYLVKSIQVQQYTCTIY